MCLLEINIAYNHFRVLASQYAKAVLATQKSKAYELLDGHHYSFFIGVAYPCNTDPLVFTEVLIKIHWALPSEIADQVIDLHDTLFCAVTVYYSAILEHKQLHKGAFIDEW